MRTTAKSPTAAARCSVRRDITINSAASCSHHRLGTCHAGEAANGYRAASKAPVSDRRDIRSSNTRNSRTDPGHRSRRDTLVASRTGSLAVCVLGEIAINPAASW